GAPRLGDRPCVTIDHAVELPPAPGDLPAVAPGAPLYLIYTPGSTGQPKGVVVTHANVASLVLPASWAKLPSRPRFLFHSPASFDASTLEIWLPLARGGTCVVYPQPRLDPLTLGTFVRNQRVDTAFFTTSLFNVLVDTAPVALEPLECLLFGGEAASPAHLARAASALPRTRLVNAYGPTETTVFATAWTVPDGCQAALGVLIGQPLPGRRVYVLDERLEPVPVGVPGEVCIGGAAVAAGYHARPEQTAAHFVPDPFGPPGSRLYRTGDLGRWTQGGELEFLGRRDGQVKIRGHRIEPGEIEGVLGQHPAVRRCAVLCRGEGEARMLVAYVVPATSAAQVTSLCPPYLAERLPAYLLPDRWACLESLPLAATGKVDRAALAATIPVPQAPVPAAAAAPTDELERRLVGLWEEVLGVRPVGIRDSFFDLGGHSLLAVRLMRRAEDVVGRPLPLALLFQAATVERLAAALRHEGCPAPPSLVALQPSGYRPPLFCIPANMGNVHADLRGLVPGLGQGQPLYGLQDGPDNPSGVRGLARRYLGQIRTVQPHGPYLLCGICGGGVVAFEMAQQLQAQGERVGLLALVEPAAPRERGLHPLWARGSATLTRIFGRSTHHARRLRQRSLGERRAYLRQKTKVLTNMLALVLYAPLPYAGAVQLLLSHQSLAMADNPRLAWRRWARGGCEVHEVPGTHDSLTGGNDTPVDAAHLRAVGERLRACIDAALAG
ncbi:MAG: AMP-binding protein, partial [Candidatus Latescibacterota bacterium]